MNRTDIMNKLASIKLQIHDLTRRRSPLDTQLNNWQVAELQKLLDRSKESLRELKEWL